MKKFILMILFVLFFPSFSKGYEGAYKLVFKYNTFQEALMASNQQGKELLVFISNNPQPEQAAKIAGFTDTEENIQKFSTQFICVLLNKDDLQAGELLKKYEIKYTPVTLRFSLLQKVKEIIYGGASYTNAEAKKATQYLFTLYQNGERNPSFMEYLIANGPADQKGNLIISYFGSVAATKWGEARYLKTLCGTTMDVRFPLIPALQANARQLNVDWASQSSNRSCRSVDDIVMKSVDYSIKTAIKTRDKKLFKEAQKLAETYPQNQYLPQVWLSTIQYCEKYKESGSFGVCRKLKMYKSKIEP